MTPEIAITFEQQIRTGRREGCLCYLIELIGQGMPGAEERRTLIPSAATAYRILSASVAIMVA
jgi:hypothetical protein